MKIKKITVSLFLSLWTTIFVYSQSIGKMVVMDSPKNYIGQTTDKGNAKNGLGIQNRGDVIYIGDFNSNKYHGKGILYTENGIEGLPDAAVYVGGWVKGKKQGNANCYDVFGQLIYSGRFEGDKPVSKFPQEKGRTGKTFAFTELSDGSYYLGEMKDSQVDGFGLVMTDDVYWIGTHRNGTKHGVGILIYSHTDWQQVSYKAGTCKYLDSSGEAAARNQQVKSVNAQVWSDFISKMSEALNSLAEIAKDYEKAQAENVESSSLPSTQEKQERKEDSYYIPHLLQKLESQCRDIESGKYLKKSGIPIDQKTAERVTAASLKEWRERMDFLIKYSNKHQTNYISKKEYGRMVNVKSEAQKRNREINRKYQHECRKIRQRSRYNNYASLISDVYFGYADFSADEIKDMQKRMRELREKYGYNKSEWEDWLK